MNERIAELIRSGWQLRETEQWERMLELANEARQLSEQTGFAAGTARSYALEGFVHYIRADFQPALGACIEALRLGSGDAEAEGSARSVLALVHWSLGNYEEALQNADASIDLQARIGDCGTLAFAHAVKGGILLSLGQLDEALAAHQKSLEVFRASPGEVVGRARALSGLGLTYLAKKRHEEALAALLEALELARRAHHRTTTARALNDVGEAFEALGDDEQALQYHTEALEIRRVEGFRQAATTSLLAVGRVCGRLGQPERALQLLEEGLALAKELGIRPRIAQFHHTLAEIYQKQGQLACALEHFLAWEAVKSELAADQAALRYKAVAFETQYETMQREVELESLASLGSLVAAITHEVNSPLGAIHSSASVAMLAADKLDGGADAKSVETIRTNSRVILDGARRISNLMARLKVFAGLDQARYLEVDLVAAIEDTIALVRPEFEERVRVTFEHEAPVPAIYGYGAELHQLFLNLLRNGVQAIEGAGSVQVRLTVDAEAFRIAFEDTGRGIPADVIPRLFTPAFNARTGRVRASLSLFTCMAIVKKHRGELQVESREGQGSTFTVALPRTLERPNPEMEGRLAQ